MAKDDDHHDFIPLSAADPVKDWKRWKRDLMAHLQALTDESGTSPMEHIFDRDMGGGAAGAPAMPGGAGAAALKMQRLRPKRANTAYATIYRHLESIDLKATAAETFQVPVDAIGLFQYLEGYRQHLSGEIHSAGRRGLQGKVPPQEYPHWQGSS